MYIPVVGLEIHVQLNSKSKMFCRCSTDYFSKEPNINVCPVCMGFPGALPVPNKIAFEKCLQMALALECKIHQETKFDRKNYFYPDLPKGYQISQFDQPIGYEGFVEIEVEGDNRRIRIQRVHLEEDTAKSIHGNNNETLIDYNKSGVALMEIVTYPDFESVEEVTAFAKRLKQMVRYLDVSDAEMQKGQMRFELNVSVKDPDKMPANVLPNYKVEVKNIGSISVLEKVMNFEFKRQSELLEKGEKIFSQTRGLKDMTGETLFQRTKETSDDYRYFPEPDIPPIKITDEPIAKLKSELPELPHQRKQRYMALGLEGEQADIFVEDQTKGSWFDKLIVEVTEKITDPTKSKVLIKELAKWITGEISAYLEKKSLNIENSPFSQIWLLELIELIQEHKITGTIAKKLIEEEFSNLEKDKTYKEKQTPLEIVTAKGYLQVSDSSEISKIAEEVIAANEKVVSDISKNPNAIKFLVGQVMKQSRGKANPKIAEEEIKKKLKIKD